LICEAENGANVKKGTYVVTRFATEVEAEKPSKIKLKS